MMPWLEIGTGVYLVAVFALWIFIKGEKDDEDQE